MLALESLDDTADIKLYINSQGALRPRRAARSRRAAVRTQHLRLPGAWRQGTLELVVCAGRRASVLYQRHPGHHRSRAARCEHHSHRAVRQHRHAAAGALPCRRLPAQRMQQNPCGAAWPCAARARRLALRGRDRAAGGRQEGQALQHAQRAHHDAPAGGCGPCGAPPPASPARAEARLQRLRAAPRCSGTRGRAALPQRARLTGPRRQAAPWARQTRSTSRRPS